MITLLSLRTLLRSPLLLLPLRSRMVTCERSLRIVLLMLAEWARVRLVFSLVCFHERRRLSYGTRLLGRHVRVLLR